MRTRNLTLAILFGLGITHTPLLVAPVQAAEVQSSLEQVKARINTFDELMTRATNRLLGTTPTVDRIMFNTSDYQSTATGADARTTLTIDFAPRYLQQGAPKTFTLNFADTITINDELQSQGIVARIDRKVIIDDNLKKLLDLSDQDIKKFSHALQYLEMHMDLLPEGKIEQVLKINPFEFEDSGTTIKFAGLTVNSEENEASIIDGAGKIHLEAGQFSTSSEGSTLILNPFTLDYSLSDDGNLKLNISAIEITNTDQSAEENTEFTIKRITGQGSNIVFDDAIASYIGQEEYVLDTIQFSNHDIPTSITIDSLHIHSDVSKSGDLYEFSGGIVVDFDGQSISKISGITGLEFEDSKLNFESKNISAKTMQTIDQIYAVVGALQGDEQEDQKFYDELKGYSKTILNELTQNQSQFKFNVAFDTDQGDATFVTNIKVKKDAVTDITQWEAAFKAQQPAQMISLLQRSIDFDLKLNVPESLLNATGLTPMVAMSAGFIVKDGSNYTMHIESSGDGIKLNGNVVPLPTE